ncbi:MAG: hypothetical protein D6704_05270 [Nitrospirae bacterium]|nr:MAG: hypothetical protein D6704_05270 [Nitrospirota bacterium]
MSKLARNPLRHKRGDILDGAPLHSAPENELGVVFLFAHLARRWRLRIEKFGAGFPDCIAYQKVQEGEKRVRIEFEYKSRSFKTHGHSPRGCDWIVCWEHNWADAPSSLRIVELRREFGLGFNVWIMPVNDPYKEVLLDTKSAIWSVPSQAHKNDLVVFYFTRPEKAFTYIYRLRDRANKIWADWKRGKDYMAPITRVCELRSPIFLEDLKRHSVLSTSPFSRFQRGRPNVTEYWPYLYDMIMRRNPPLKQQLSKYVPEHFL